MPLFSSFWDFMGLALFSDWWTKIPVSLIHHTCGCPSSLLCWGLFLVEPHKLIPNVNQDVLLFLFPTEKTIYLSDGGFREWSFKIFWLSHGGVIPHQSQSLCANCLDLRRIIIIYTPELIFHSKSEGFSKMESQPTEKGRPGKVIPYHFERATEIKTPCCSFFWLT